MIYSHSKAKGNAFAIVVVFLSLLLATFFGLSNSVKAQSSIGTACEEPPNYVGGPIYRLICNGNTIVTEQCNTVEDCNALYSKEYRQCKDGSYECARKCEKERSDSCSRSNGAPGCGDVLQACSAACSKVNVQCYQMVRDDAKKCEKRRHWEKSHISGGFECEAGTPCVQVCDTGTQCVQNGDDAKCVRSSGQPVSPPAENAPPALPEATIPLVENVPEVEALVEKQPAPDDFSPGLTEEDSIPEELRKRKAITPYLPASSFNEHPLRIMVAHAEGQPELHLPNGTIVILHQNDYIEVPLGAKIITPPRSRVQIGGFLWLEESSRVEFKPWLPPVASPDLPALATFEIQKGYGRFREQGTVLRKFSEIGVGILTRGTDFAIAFDPITKLTTIELYDGGADVTGSDGTTLATLDTKYGGPIQRVEVTEGGKMIQQVAIPKDEWQVRKAEAALQSQPEENRSNGLLWAFIFLVLGGTVFALYKTGKLRPMLQKVSALARRDDSKPL